MFQKQIFEPPHRHLEEKQEEQRGMEEAFENMYMQATGQCFVLHDSHVYFWSFKGWSQVLNVQKTSAV